MRALASVVSGVVKAEIEIEATPARVFRALTDPTELAAFWGSDDMYRTSDWKIDLRPGGSWSAVARGADGSGMTVDGEYRRSTQLGSSCSPGGRAGMTTR